MLAISQNLTRISHGWRGFWFGAKDARPLDLVRIILGIAMLGEYSLLFPDVSLFFGPSGIAPTSIATGWIEWPYLDSIFLHLRTEAELRAVYGLFLASLVCYTIGFQTRIAKVIVWYLHLALFFRNQEIVYGVDRLINCVLPLMVVAPLGRHYAVDTILRKKRGPSRSDAWSKPEMRASIVLRMIQIQLAMVYLWAGLSKLKHSHWWHGHAVWRAFVNPEYGSPGLMQLLAAHYALGNFFTYMTLIVEISYPYMIWNEKRRPYLLLGIIGMHAGIAVMMKLYYFALVMIGVNFAFLTSAAVDFVERVVFRRNIVRTSSPPDTESEVRASA